MKKRTRKWSGGGVEDGGGRKCGGRLAEADRRTVGAKQYVQCTVRNVCLKTKI